MYVNWVVLCQASFMMGAVSIISVVSIIPIAKSRKTVSFGISNIYAIFRLTRSIIAETTVSDNRILFPKTFGMLSP